ncbi:MAG: hypothetical protein CSA75_05165, partial [Sorangium cellulosum]
MRTGSAPPSKSKSEQVKARPSRESAEQGTSTVTGSQQPNLNVKGYLEITRSGESGLQRQPLVGSHLIMGRNPNAQIVLDHTTVSRSHAELVHDPFGRWWVHDLHSTNGTYVNGTPVEERMLNPGDSIDIGDFTLRLHVHGQRDQAESIYSLPDAPPQLSAVDEDATLITVMPKQVDSPQISASHLTTVMALTRQLMSVEDASKRLRTLCEFVVGSDFPADSAVTIRLRNGKPTKVVSGPFLRNPSTSPGRQVSVGVLKSLWDTREPVLGSNGLNTCQGIRRLSVPNSVRQLAVVACPLVVDENKIDALYVEFPPTYGTAEWLTLVALVTDAYQQAELVWEMRRHVRQSAFVERELQMARQIQEGLVPGVLHI